MNHTKRLLALALALLTIGGAMASCGDQPAGNNPSDKQTGGVESKETTAAKEEEPTVAMLDTLLDANYNGYEFKTLLNDQDERFVDIMTEGEETGDTMNDLVYRRNAAVEEKYNIKISGESDEYGKVNEKLKKTVQAGMYEYDLYFSNSYAISLASEGFLYLLNDLPNLDLTKPWWDQASLNSLSVGGKMYLATGDVSPTSLLTSSCLVFNKNLFAANDMEYPYQMAADGKWTIDRLIEMTKGISRDMNGDGKMVYGEDLYSFSSWMCDSPYSLFYGSGGALSRKTDDDIPEIYIDMDKTTAIYEKMYQIIVENESYFVTDAAQYQTTYENFANGNAYFCEITLMKIDDFLRDMKDDYGILPMPKWNEEQPTYLSCVNSAGGQVVVPNNPEDAERTGMIFEALGAAAYDMITPSLFDVITKTKNVRDEESADMVELIIRQRVFDPMYTSLITGFDWAQGMLKDKKTDVASTLAKQQKAMEKAMEKLVKAYQENE